MDDVLVDRRSQNHRSQKHAVAIVQRLERLERLFRTHKLLLAKMALTFLHVNGNIPLRLTASSAAAAAFN